MWWQQSNLFCAWHRSACASQFLLMWCHQLDCVWVWNNQHVSSHFLNKYVSKQTVCIQHRHLCMTACLQLYSPRWWTNHQVSQSYLFIAYSETKSWWKHLKLRKLVRWDSNLQFLPTYIGELTENEQTHKHILTAYPRPATCTLVAQLLYIHTPPDKSFIHLQLPRTRNKLYFILTVELLSKRTIHKQNQNDHVFSRFLHWNFILHNTNF